MARRRVLVITQWYPTPERPVERVFVREHARAVARYDDVRVLHAVGPDPALRRAYRWAEETNEVVTQGLSTARLWWRLSPIPATSYPVYVWSVIDLARRWAVGGFRPDIIHAHGYEAALAAVVLGRVMGIPVVATEHFSAFMRRTLSRRDLWKARLAYRRAALVMPVSQALQRAMQACGIRARFRVVPNVVDTGLFYPNAAFRSAALPRRLLFVGALEPTHVKGVPELLQALARLRARRDDWRLDLVGDGPARATYEQHALEAGLVAHVRFHGAQSRQEVADWMRRADLFVLASRVETFSVAAAEALACGVPVVATRCGGPEAFITGDVGMLVPAGDPGALGDAIDRMLHELPRFVPERLAAYAAARFSPEVVGAELHTIYAEVEG